MIIEPRNLTEVSVQDDMAAHLEELETEEKGKVLLHVRLINY